MFAATRHFPTRAVQGYKKFALKLTFRVSRYSDDTLGQKIRRRRFESGMTQKGLAQVLGVNKGTVRSWEKGRTRLAIGFLRRIEGIFGKNYSFAMDRSCF